MSSALPPQGTPASQPEPVKKRNWFLRHKIISVILAIIGISILSSALGGGDQTDPVATGSGATEAQSSSSPSSSSAAKKTAAKKTAAAKPVKAVSQLGSPVKDGKFQFTVTKVKCGRTQVGSKDFGEKAQGEFCEAHLTVENVGDEPQTLFGDNQYLYDAKKRKFSPDSGAAIYLEDSNSFLEEINPGNSIKGILLFDVPKGTKPVSMELHDSAFSGGVKVAL